MFFFLALFHFSVTQKTLWSYAIAKKNQLLFFYLKVYKIAKMLTLLSLQYTALVNRSDGGFATLALPDSFALM